MLHKILFLLPFCTSVHAFDKEEWYASQTKAVKQVEADWDKLPSLSEKHENIKKICCSIAFVGNAVKNTEDYFGYWGALNNYKSVMNIVYNDTSNPNKTMPSEHEMRCDAKYNCWGGLVKKYNLKVIELVQAHLNKKN